ncbi:hypothetical protein EKG40_03700 [Pseudomonas moorei]|nr:hypothetical protein EKG40_03700 [Pseudomonas moorei]
MRVEESITRSGEFFTLANPAKKYFGTLSISDGGLINVEIYSDSAEFIKYDEPQLGRLIGKVERGYVTLEGCTFQKMGFGHGLPARSVIVATQALLGKGFEEENPLYAEYFFSVDCLDEWLMRPGMKITYGDRHNQATLTFDKPEPLSFLLHDGTQVSLDFNVTTPTSQSYPETSIFQKAFFSLRAPEPQSIEFYRSLSHKITRLMSFLVGYSLNIHSVHGVAISAHRNQPGQLIEIYYPSMHLNPFRRLRSDEMMLSFKSIAERFGQLLANWVESYDVLTPALHHFFAVQDASHKYQDTRFLAMAQGLETFHRRTAPSETQMEPSDFQAMVTRILKSCGEEDANWLEGRLIYGNELTLLKRLNQLIAPFQELFGTKRDCAYIVRKTVETRNYFTHFDKRLEAKALNGSKLVYVIYRLRVLFIFNILFHLGFTTDEIIRLGDQPYLKRMRQVGKL